MFENTFINYDMEDKIHLRSDKHSSRQLCMQNGIEITKYLMLFKIMVVWYENKIIMVAQLN